MKTKLVLTLTALALPLCLSHCTEKEKNEKPPRGSAKRAEMFLKSDDDKDGKLSKVEFAKLNEVEFAKLATLGFGPTGGMKKERIAEAGDRGFGRMDKNKDGFLDKVEFSVTPYSQKPKEGDKSKDESKPKQEAEPAEVKNP